MNKQFQSLAVGDRFMFNNLEFVKISEVRVTCCKVINCQSVSNPSETTFVSADTLVTVNG